MRPVIRNTNPSYQIPPEIQISSVTVRRFFDWLNLPKRTTTIYKTPGILNWMALATDVNKGADKWTKLSAYYKAKHKSALAVEAIQYLMKNVFTDGTNTAYGNARLSLIQNFGQYCSYCGMPVYDSSLAVEHMLPKASFPNVMMCYPNFLLACPICNSKKGEQPSYSQSLQWWKKTNPTIPNPTFAQIQEGGLSYPIFPDNPATNLSVYTYKAYILTLWQYIAPFNQPVATNLAYDLRNYWLNTNNNKVAAMVWDGTKLVQWELFTQYTGDNPNPPAPNTLQRAKNTIAMVGLDSTDPNDNKMTDRRDINRTVAFFEAIKAYDRLQYIFVTTKGGPIYDLFCHQVFNTARLSGFYEVWINVFYYLCQQPASKIPNFYGSFKTFTCNPSEPSAYLPGTDASRLP